MHESYASWINDDIILSAVSFAFSSVSCHNPYQLVCQCLDEQIVFVFVRVTDSSQSNVTYTFHQQHTDRESHLAIWSPETACQTAVISWCSGQNFRSLSVEASKMKPFLYVCLLRRSATVVDWNWQYLLLWMLCMIHTIEGPLTRAKRRVWKSQLGLRDWCSLQKLI